MEITFANNKYASSVKKTIKTDMALLLTKLVESFAIANLDTLIDCEFPRLTVLYNKIHFASPSMRT